MRRHRSLSLPVRLPRPALALGLLVALLFLAACGGGSSRVLPEGWQAFSEGPFSGGIRDNWTPAYLDVSDPDFGDALPEDIPSSIIEAIAEFLDAGNSPNVFFVFLELNPEFSSNINILPCESAQAGAFLSNSANVIQYYEAQGMRVSRRGNLTYDGRNFDLIQLHISESFDTHQVYLETDDCYTAVTLTSRPGNTGSVDDFRTFVSLLNIDARRLSR
jgi:hypothetical protein